MADSEYYSPDGIEATTAVPNMVFSDSGVTSPDLLDVLNGFLTDWQNAIGQDASRDLTTPQGQISVSSTAIVGNKNDQLLEIANQINPDYSSGRWQDAIGRIYFMDRIAATGTTVSAECTGLVGTTIPQGSYAQDKSGYVYYSTSDATIPASGKVTVQFVNTSSGAIECPADSLTTIYSAVDGWSTVNNPSSGTLGRDEETRSAFEIRRRAQVTLNSKNTAESVYAAISNISGVTDVYVQSNNTAGVLLRGGIEIPVGTCYIAVNGGSNSDIAKAIYERLNIGCATECNTDTEESYTVQDRVNYESNYPEYTFYFTRPKNVDVYFKVSIENNDRIPNTINSDISSAIVTAFMGDDGGTKASIGTPIYASRYYGGIQAVDQQNINILDVQVSKDGNNFSSFVTFNNDELPVLSSSNIAVVQVDD